MPPTGSCLYNLSLPEIHLGRKEGKDRGGALWYSKLQVVLSDKNLRL